MNRSKLFLSMFFISLLSLSACSKTYLLTENFVLNNYESVLFGERLIARKGDDVCDVQNHEFKVFANRHHLNFLKRKTSVRPQSSYISQNDCLFVINDYLYICGAYIQVFNEELTRLYAFDVKKTIRDIFEIDNINQENLISYSFVFFDNNIYYSSELRDNNRTTIAKTFFIFDTFKDEFVFPTYYDYGDIVYIDNHAFSIKNNEIYPLEDDYQYHVRSMEFNKKDNNITFNLPTESQLCTIDQNVNVFYFQTCKKQIKNKFYFILSESIIDERYYTSTREYINENVIYKYSFGLSGDTYLYSYDARNNELTVVRDLGFGVFVIDIDNDLNVIYFKDDGIYKNDTLLAFLNIKHEKRTGIWNWFSGILRTYYSNHCFGCLGNDYYYYSVTYNEETDQWNSSNRVWI